MDVERHLDKVFADAANERAKDEIGKTFEYTLYKDAFQSEVISEGTCEVTARYYDKYQDCDMISIRDIDTGKLYTQNMFALDIREIAA